MFYLTRSCISSYFFLCAAILFLFIYNTHGQDNIARLSPSTTSIESNTLLPAAVPVLTPEEAQEANERALKKYNNRRIKHLTGKLILVVSSILCITVLMLAIPFGKIKHIRFLHVWDFVGWGVISFVVMYCTLLIFQINRPGFEFLTSLQPILSTPSLYLFFGALFLFVIVFIKRILPFLLKCKTYELFIIELLFAISIGTFVISHFSIEPVSDFEVLATRAAQWQTSPFNEIKKMISAPTSSVTQRRCFYSYYLLYKFFGCNYLYIEISQLVMHLLLGINVYFLAKQCELREKIARLSMILYFFMPAQYLYLTIPSLDLWGGMLLCFNANLTIYLFKKSPQLLWYKRDVPTNPDLNSKTESNSFYGLIRRHFLYLAIFFKRIPWVFPLLVSILLGITLFWMEMVRNLQMLFCISMFLFLSAVQFQRIFAKKIHLFSRTMLFVCVLCLLIPFLSNKTVQVLCDAPPLSSNGVPVVTVMFNTPDEIREVIRFADFHLHLTSPERRKDFALDAAVSYWNLYPSNYSRYFGNKINRLTDLFNPEFVATPKSTIKYSQEFIIYSFLVWIVRVIFVPFLLIGILFTLFSKHWNSLTFVPIVLFFIFFIIMPTVGEVQARYTSIYYAPMCICAACTLLISPRSFSFFKKKHLQTRFLNSILWGTTCIIVLLFAITLFFSNSSVFERHQLINFHENQREVSSGDFPVAYREHTDRNFLLSSIFHPTGVNVIPKPTYVEWTIPEHTTEGHEHILYGYLIAPLKDNADFVVKINGTAVWDNSAFAKKGSAYSNSKINIDNEKIIFLDNLMFTAERENILRVEIVPKNNHFVDFALSAWGMVPCK